MPCVLAPSRVRRARPSGPVGSRRRRRCTAAPAQDGRETEAANTGCCTAGKATKAKKAKKPKEVEGAQMAKKPKTALETGPILCGMPFCDDPTTTTVNVVEGVPFVRWCWVTIDEETGMGMWMCEGAGHTPSVRHSPSVPPPAPATTSALRQHLL